MLINVKMPAFISMINKTSESLKARKVFIFQHFSFYEQLKFPGPEVIKLFPCSTQLRMKFIMLINAKMSTIVGILTFISMLINVKMSTIVGILTFISMINKTSEFESKKSLYFSAF